MNLFQLLTLPPIAVLFVWSAIRLAKQYRLWNLLWAALWLVGGVVIAFPDLTAILAHALGISRGVDLMIYLSVLCAGVGFFMMYSHVQRLQMQLTTLVRELSIQQTLNEQRRLEQQAGLESQP